MLRWLIALRGGAWNGSWEENSDRWDRVDVFRHVVPRVCVCVAVLLPLLSLRQLLRQMELRTHPPHTQKSTYTKYTLANWTETQYV